MVEMAQVSITQGWMLLARALVVSRLGSLPQAAEWMWRLNVFARSAGRHSIVDQIYSLKNDLIQYLYQNGYSTEARLHQQKRYCYSCDGTGEYWTGDDCWKCNGTGIFSITKLYAFRFDVSGRRYGWHQLEKLIDYPVELTVHGEPEEVTIGQGNGEPLDLSDAWLGCCVVWWCLLFHGVRSELILFAAARNWMKIAPRRFLQKWSRHEDDMPF